MTEQLTQVLQRIPETGAKVSQLQMLFKHLNGQSLTAFLTYRANLAQLQLPLQLPQGMNQQATNSQLESHWSDGKLNQLLNQIRLPLSLNLTPQLQQNRISFLVNDDINQFIKQNNLSTTAAKALLVELARVLAQSKPIIEFQFSRNTAATQSYVTDLRSVKTLISDNSFNTQSQHSKRIVSDLVQKSITSTDALNSKPNAQIKQGLVSDSVTGGKANTATHHPLTSRNVIGDSSSQLLKQLIASTAKQTNDTVRISQHASAKTPKQGDSSLPIKTYQQNLAVKLSELPSQQLALQHFKSLLKYDFQQQQPIHQTINSINQLLPQLADNLNLDKQNTQFFLDTLKQLPQGSRVSADSIRQLIQNSGVFRESQLKEWLHQSGLSSPASASTASTTSPLLLSGDIKSLFASLQYLLLGTSSTPMSENARLLQPSLMKAFLMNLQQRLVGHKQDSASIRTQQLLQLMSDLESGLSRTRVLQHQNLPIEAAGSQPWLFELPLAQGKHYSSVQLKLEQESSRKNAKSPKVWRITIRFEFDSLGAFSALAELKQDRLGVRFYAEKAETLELLNSELATLETSLAESGLTLDKGESKIKKVPSLIEPKQDDSLVDVTI